MSQHVTIERVRVISEKKILVYVQGARSGYQRRLKQGRFTLSGREYELQHGEAVCVLDRPSTR